MGASAPPKSPPYQPIYPVEANSIGEMLFPTSMHTSVPSTSGGTVRPAISKPFETSGFYGKTGGRVKSGNYTPPNAGTPPVSPQTFPNGTNPIYDEYLKYALSMLNPNLHRKG